VGVINFQKSTEVNSLSSSPATKRFVVHFKLKQHFLVIEILYAVHS